MACCASRLCRIPDNPISPATRSGTRLLKTQQPCKKIADTMAQLSSQSSLPRFVLRLIESLDENRSGTDKELVNALRSEGFSVKPDLREQLGRVWKRCLD